MALAEHVVAADAENALGRRVDVDETPLRVAGEEGIADALQRCQKLLVGRSALGKPLFGFRLGLPLGLAGEKLAPPPGLKLPAAGAGHRAGRQQAQ